MSTMNTYKTKTEILLLEIRDILNDAVGDSLDNEAFTLLQNTMLDRVDKFDKNYELWEV